MKLATPCYQYVIDWFAQPLSPTHVLYNDIHQKRLNRIIPEVSEIIYRFFEDMPFFQISLLKMDMESYEKYISELLKDHPEKGRLIKRVCWKHTYEMCDDASVNDFDTIQCLMQEHGVCKDKAAITEWIGYCIESLECIKNIHTEYHMSKKPKVPAPIRIMYESKEEFDPYS
jgi:hypothetical protein